MDPLYTLASELRSVLIYRSAVEPHYPSRLIMFYVRRELIMRECVYNNSNQGDLPKSRELLLSKVVNVAFTVTNLHYMKLHM